MARKVYMEEMTIKVTLSEYSLTHKLAKIVVRDLKRIKVKFPNIISILSASLLESLKKLLMAGQRLTDAECGADANQAFSYRAEIQEIEDELKRRHSHK